MKTIKSDILQTFLLLIILNALALLFFGAIEIFMIYMIGKSKEVSEMGSYTYVTISNFNYNINDITFNLLIPILSYLLFLFTSIIIYIYEINKFIKEINKFNKNTAISLDTLQVNKDSYKYLELKQGNDTINEAIFKIQRNNLLEKEIVSSVMHDLKTPLQIISGYNDLNMLENSTKYSKDIEHNLKGVNKMLENSLLEEERFLIGEVDVIFVIEELLRDYRNMYVDVKFILDVDNKEVRWNVDKVSFKRIIINLLDNAIGALGEEKEVIISLKENEIFIKNLGEKLSGEELEKYINMKELEHKGLGLKTVKRYCDKNAIDLDIVADQVYTVVRLKKILDN